jgi:AraC-like DNA-binding protein
VVDIIRWDRLSPAEQFDGWREAVSNTFVPLEAAALTDRAFGGALASQTIGQVQLSQVSGGAVRVARTSRTVRRNDPECYKLGMQVRGYCVLDQDGREAALTPGDFAIYDTTRPYALTFDQDFQMFVVMFPRALLSLKPEDMTGLTARRVSGRRGMGALVSPFLVGLAQQMDADDLTASMHLADGVVDLLAATFAEQLGCASAVPAETHRHALMLRITAFIDARLDDPELSCPTIAAAHHISVRYLQKLFESDGCTVTSWIRTRRLERCRLDLADPKLSALPVSAVAARWGLLDASHFARIFKTTYGHTPREYRLSLQQHPSHSTPGKSG